LAQEYLEKLKNGDVSPDWAYKVLVNSIREQRMLKMIAVAEQRHLNHDNLEELIELIASEMRKQVLDPTNEDNFDCYLNSKIM
jgi:ERCC4-related helicase